MESRIVFRSGTLWQGAVGRIIRITAISASAMMQVAEK
jgi:hypothetical protein